MYTAPTLTVHTYVNEECEPSTYGCTNMNITCTPPLLYTTWYKPYIWQTVVWSSGSKNNNFKEHSILTPTYTCAYIPLSFISGHALRITLSNPSWVAPRCCNPASVNWGERQLLALTHLGWFWPHVGRGLQSIKHWMRVHTYIQYDITLHAERKWSHIHSTQSLYNGCQEY